MPTQKRKKSAPAPDAETLPAIPPPRWVPPGVDFNMFSSEVQIAIVEIINPLYERLVLQTDDSLEKSTGLTVVYLLWMEILNQYELGKQYMPDAFLREAASPYGDTFARQLQLVDAKTKTSYILLRLRELRQSYVPLSNPPTLPHPEQTVLAIPSQEILDPID
jgi:hypothetical protein